MKEIFKCDHLIFKPDTETLIKMNRLGFYIQGDMNWHNHCGIYTYPIQEAIKNNIKFILWVNMIICIELECILMMTMLSSPKNIEKSTA